MTISLAMFVMCVFVIIVLILEHSKKQTKLNVKTLEELFEDPEGVKREIKSTDTSVCVNKPPCGPNKIEKQNTYGDICCYTDSETEPVSTEDQVINIIQTIGPGIITDEIKEKILLSFASNLLKGSTSNKLPTYMSKILLKNGVNAVKKSTARMVVNKLIKDQLKKKLGRINFAMFAFDAVSMALDLWDPMGYNNWQSNIVWKNLRNVSESEYEEILNNDGKPYPFLAPYMYNESNELKIQEIVVSVKELIDHMVTEHGSMFLIVFHDFPLSLNNFPPEDDPRWEELYSRLESRMNELIDSKEFEEYTCRDVKNAGFNVTWNVDLKQCSLDEKGCDEFNEYQNTLPEGERFFAMYTKEYRIRDPRNPGDNKKPNMITRKLNQSICLISPLIENATTCINDTNGSTWNPDVGMCDFSNSHCDRYGLKRTTMNIDGHIIHNCDLYPGQLFAEFMFGSTITRGTMSVIRDVKSALYVDKMNNLAGKYIVLYNVSADIARHMLMSTADLGAKILQEVGEVMFDAVVIALRNISRLGKATVDVFIKVMDNPLVIFSDPTLILRVIMGGIENIVGLVSHIATQLFNIAVHITEHIFKTFKDLGKRIINEFKSIGKDIAEFFKGF